jgi:hypothetical protein
MGRSEVGGSGDSNRRRIPGSREGTDYSQVGECHNLPDIFAVRIRIILRSRIRISVTIWIRVRIKAESGFRIHIKVEIQELWLGAQNGTLQGRGRSQRRSRGLKWRSGVCIPDVYQICITLMRNRIRTRIKVKRGVGSALSPHR